MPHRKEEAEGHNQQHGLTHARHAHHIERGTADHTRWSATEETLSVHLPYSPQILLNLTAAY
jgi:hypothetical protein